MVLRRLKIGSRLAVGFGILLVAMTAVMLLSTYLERVNRESLMSTISTAGEKERLAVEMKLLALEQSSALRNLVILVDQKALAAENDRITSIAASMDATRDRMGKLELNATERELVGNLTRIDAEFEAPVKTAYEYASIFRTEDTGNLLLRVIDPLVQRQLSDLDTLVQLQRGAHQEVVSASVARAEQVVWVRLGAAAVAIAMLVVFAWLLTRSITVPLGEAVQVARRVASGDLTSNVRVEGGDEAAQLLGALREMNNGLGGIVTRIRTGAEAIALGADEVASGNQQLSSRTEEHASSLQQTASTLEQFTGTVRQNAEHAQQASALAGDASSTAERGGQVVAKVVETMREVTESSKRISDIIGVIDGISFQTNILALNAAVEAARAGEQGRGFAVVASEVRSLAQRSAASAKEIRGLIENSVGRVEASARLVQQAGQTIDELVVSVRKVAAIMTEIASASHEQSSGIDQINKAITEMDNVVQTNASIVEEATAAATSMAQQAAGLASAVAQFRVDESAAPVAQEPAQQLSQPPRPARPALARKGESPAPRQPVLAHGGDEWKEF